MKIKLLYKIPEWIWVAGLFLISHLKSLTLLPVFADEAIYIRWAQLIQDDPGRYTFFSMMDGKPPLFIWLLSWALRLFSDPLFASRFLSVLVGLFTVFSLRSIVREFTEDRVARWTVTLAGTFLPFWFFYHRMALMDSLLALFLAISFSFAIRLSKSKPKNSREKIEDIILLGVFFGAALMTKIPAIFAIPIIAITPVYFWRLEDKRSLTSLIFKLLPVAIGGFLGCLFFLMLKISPLFGSLFSRSTDFTFTFHDLITGEWRYVLGNSFRRNMGWIVFYFSPGLALIPFLGLWMKKNRHHIIFLLFSAFIFFAPLTLFGRVLWPRYFLPCIIFLTIAAAVALPELLKHRVLKTISITLLLIAIGCSFYTTIASYTNPAKIPFVPEDKSQYLNEWSAGYGNTEVRAYIVERQKHLSSDSSKKIIVLTEGSFGTLPDGLLMYFHGEEKAKNLEIHGIGLNVPRIPEEFLVLAKANEVYYMVNSHRLGIVDLNSLKKIFEVKRPNGPSLLLFQVIPK